MKIEHNSVVRFHYRVGEAGQTPGESSFEGDPIAALIGHGSLVPGLEQGLLGREAGERLELTLTPELAYGERVEDRRQRLPKKYFGDARLSPGQRVTLNTRSGPRSATVEKVGLSVVDVDLNHPLAGKTLHFEIEIVSVRPATESEVAHRHVHGDGGHDHAD